MRQLCYACSSLAFLPACTSNISRWRFLTDKEAMLIEAVSEQLIPSDSDPGAKEAKVVNFFDKQLTGYYGRHQETYRNGLNNMDQTSIQIYNKSFLDLTWDNQTRFIEKMESGNLPEEVWSKSEQRSFFNMLLDHTMQAFYGSPRHGGNCNYVSYKMMKIDYPHVIGQNRYDKV